MTPDEIKALRRTVGVSQKELAAALHVEVGLVRDWEKSERFPTRSHCDAMASLQSGPKSRGGTESDRSPIELLGDPGFFLLVRKLLAHAPLRMAVETLAAAYDDPLAADGTETREPPSGKPMQRSP